ncbi:amidophosphoribosyltransferase [Dehalobacterium formicoaceticum]|uniref:Amidophosphoribosyltransferase n=1 Tax=Dehalobacterium formicoaceticum TaxID=51515 RepID=A0ABT1Y1J6_9FIRM|nr:amidophosphoribosyltransferase [Dehalobacterium formicoaceticum]MCR6544737.1 amidophosphoribosyltransferase [Dehalobacterium formicoaceticum]
MIDLLNTDEKPKDECGLFGIYGHNMDVATMTYYGLYALQHRGQESTGITVSDGKEFKNHKDMGLVGEVFNEKILAPLKGHLAIGHVRYSTVDSGLAVNTQPLDFRYLKGLISLAHNGSLINANEIRQRLALNGSVFQTTSDTEVIVKLIARYGQSSIEEALMKMMIDIKGAYSLLVMTEDQLIGVRDPHGVRPLCIGKKGKSYILASETCALDTVGAEFIRDVDPGEIVIIDNDGLRSIHAMKSSEQAFCIFEFVYLARPDSNFDGRNVTLVRRAMGRQLAQEYPIDADIVIPVPDSGVPAALGYAEASGIPYMEGLMKNRYIGRTFIKPTQKMRETAVRLKLNPIRDIIEGKRVVMVDDSVVRGTTSKQIVQMIRNAGAKEVHLMVSSPTVKYPCYYGIDTQERNQLIAVKQSIEEIREYIGADGLHFLSLEGMVEATGSSKDSFCAACFTGEYPLGISKRVGEYPMEQEVE